MSRLMLAVLVLGAFAARADEAFPWTGEQRLVNKGGTLVWSVKKEGDEVVIEGRHPKWSVTHKAAANGAPKETVKTVGDRKTKVVFTKDGATYQWRPDAKAKDIKEKNLWDSDSVDVRLASVKWAEGKSVKFHIVDTDTEGGDTYPMIAEYKGLEQCGGAPCHHVKMRVDDVRGLFAPTFNYYYGTGAGSPYLKFESKDDTFTAAAAGK